MLFEREINVFGFEDTLSNGNDNIHINVLFTASPVQYDNTIHRERRTIEIKKVQRKKCKNAQQ